MSVRYLITAALPLRLSGAKRAATAIESPSPSSAPASPVHKKARQGPAKQPQPKPVHNCAIADPHAPLVIVGLGNPGTEYAHTRHNIGFLVVEKLATRHNATWRSERALRAHTADVTIGGRSVLLAKPITYMNLSGEAVVKCAAKVIKSAGNTMESAAHTLVIVDETQIPFGQVRLRLKGSSGGHNGLKSIESSLRTQEYPRLRVGVSKPAQGQNLADYVLGGFNANERKHMDNFVSLCADAVELYAKETDAQRVLSAVNGKAFTLSV